MKKIKIPNEFKSRMKDLQKEYPVIFITAHAGSGKTCVMLEYLKNKKISYIHLGAEQADFTECLRKVKSGVVVLDDFQNITSENEEYLKNNLYELLRKHKFYLLSRASMPSWLKPYQIIGQVGKMNGSVFYLPEIEVKEFFEMNDVSISESEIDKIPREIRAYTLALKFLGLHIQSEGKNGTNTNEKVIQDIYDYYDEMVVQSWSRELYTFMLQMGGFESFTTGLASMISGYASIQPIVDEMKRIESFLEIEKDTYTIEPVFRKYLIYKQKRELSQAAVNNIYHNAGLYYELQSDIKNALRYYSKCGNEDKIQELLIRNSNLHPGVAHYLEAEKYYRSFPTEKILKSPDLMCGMSMLCSLNMQAEESEYWYKALKEYCKKAKKGDIEYKYAKGKLYWLAISLPHRGSANVEKLIANAVSQKNNGLVLQDVSVTSNLPSILNGGKDFSLWISRADIVYALMKTLVPCVLGKAGEGLADICIAEKMVEQADVNVYQTINYINSGIHDAATKGKIETEFVGTMLLHRMYLSQGNADTAYRLMADFKKRAEQKKQLQIIPNLDAVFALYHLRTGKKELAEIWMREEAPNENDRFNIFERYRYMVKARCYIAEEKYMEGISLLNRMIQYGTEYDRTIIRIQARILLAIILYRMKDENWKVVLEEALQEAQKYQYIRMIAEEGAAILPLLQETQMELEKSYKKKLLQHVKEEAMNHSAYLKAGSVDVEALTATEKQVLKLLGQGMKNKEIAEFLNISLNTVAYHTKNIYQKLGVNSRTQATNIAKTMENN